MEQYLIGGSPRTAPPGRNTGGLQSPGLVHFSAKTLCFQTQPMSENMDLTPLRVTLQFYWGETNGLDACWEPALYLANKHLIPW
jgi:hypothetical protein